MGRALREFYGRFATIELVRVIRCDCGFEATGDSDDELVTQTQAHAREVHDVEVASELLRELTGTKHQQAQE